MGRQVAVAMRHEDEGQFLAFLRASGEIRIFRSAAPTVAELELSGPDLGAWHQYFIWPTQFEWRPEFKQVPEGAPVVERRGWFYLSNTSTAPVLEYDRHGFDKSSAQGRLYWAKVLAAPAGLNYLRLRGLVPERRALGKEEWLSSSV